jgi:two-component system, chemotaxis family, protein-glutamate methylesterase/glutaminase
MPELKRIRAVVIDDSAFNRQTISAMLESSGEVEVVGRAADGQEGLNLVFQQQPDVVTLDLEMPKMDGFSFLRILMSKKPTPVIVISGYATKENVFKALELGALDFVAKPSRQISPALKGIQDELLQKLRLVTQLRMVSLADRAARAPAPTGQTGQYPIISSAAPPPAAASIEKSRREGPPPPKLCAIGASTGGPPAIHQLLTSIDPSLPLGIVITQHMPAKFTKAFAERLARTTPWTVREAEPGDAVLAGVALVAPGSHSLIVKRDGAQLKVELAPPDTTDRFVPSVDRMLDSLAQLPKPTPDLLAVILTGMGGDGGRGVKAVKAAGARVLAEAPETAVIFGMPEEAIRAGAVDEIVPLGAMADAITKFAKR